MTTNPSTDTDGGEESPDEGDDDPDESVDQGGNTDEEGDNTDEEGDNTDAEGVNAEGAGGTDSTDPQPDAGSAIEGSNPMPQPQPNTPGSVALTGSASEDETLTATVTDTDTLPDTANIRYQWQRDTGADSAFENIDNATSPTYTLGDTDVGQTLRVQVSYRDQRGADERLISDVTLAVTNVNDASSGSVTIDGTVREDQTLTAETTALQDADGLPADAAGYRYQWQRNTDSSFENIAGETGNTYTLDDADVGREVRVQVSYTDDGGMDDSLSSAPTAVVENVNDEPTGSVSIDGTVEEDQTLTANTDNLEIALSATETLTLEGVNRDVLTAETVTTLDEEGNDTTTPLADVNSDSDAPAFEFDDLLIDEAAITRLADWEAVNLLAPVEPQAPPSAGEDSLSAGSANRALALADPLEPPPTLVLFDADLEGYSVV